MLILTLLLTACDRDSEPAPDDVVPSYNDPTIAGPAAVGTYADELVGTSGLTLPVQVWYPAVESDDGTADRYVYDGLMKGDALKESTASCETTHPVVIFSHGSGAIRFQSYFYTERLASHDYIVAAPDHVYNTFFDDDDDKTAEVALRRPIDVADTFDWLLEQNADPDSDLFGCIDPDAGYAVTGHSFGGYTSLAVAGATLDVQAIEDYCAETPESWCDVVDQWRAEHPGSDTADLSDPRAWASVPMAPAGASLFGAGLANIHIPTLVFGGSLDDTTPVATETQPIYDGLVTQPRGLALLEGAGHLSFSDVCDIYASAAECGEGFLPVEDVQRIVNELAVPFIELTRGETRAKQYMPPDEPALSFTWVD